uniref:Fas-associated factor 1/2-like UAS domain-containing protein n=1 Tax=Ditylenchus dipsaci TaxID=166011 RepID=A0A915DMJ5_9BILA
MQNFASVFESRYGSNFAPFYRGTVEEAMAEAFEAPGRDPVERRPLLSICTTITLLGRQQYICSECDVLQ